MNEFTEAELHVLYVMLGVGVKPGSFTYSLIEAIAKADLFNFAKLKRIYPELVDAVSQYRYGDLYPRWLSANGKEAATIAALAQKGNQNETVLIE